TGRALAVRVARLDAGSAAAEAPVSLTAQGAFRATPFRLSANLPPLRDLLVSAKLSAPSAVSLQVGAADLADYAPGLKLTRLDVSAPAMDQPLQTALEGSYAGAPLSLTATLSPATALLPGAASPLALKVSAGAAGGTMMMQGSIAHPAALSGIDLAVAATVPDLAGLGPLLHRALPPLTDISFQGGLTDSGGSLRTGLTLAGARLSLPQGDLAGDVTLGFGETPSLRAALAATRIDADGLLKLLAARQAAPPAVPVEVAAPGPRPSPERVIPDRPLPFDALRRGDADLQLGAATLTQGRLTYRDVSLHLVLAGGHLHVEPISGQIAGSRVDGRLDVDLSRQPPPVSLVLQAPGVALQPLLAELGLPGEATGSLAVDADLHGAGETLHRIAARLDGHLGLSMVNGSVDNRLLDALFGALVRSGQLPPGLLGKDGRSDVRCLAARLDASHGVVAARALLLDSTRFRAAASGLVNLDDEALALRLRPFVKVGGSGLVVPLRVGGTLAAPLLELDPSAAEGTATAPPPGHGPGDALLGAAETGDCAPALALARDGRPGPTPAPEKPAKGADLLRGLFH
ncbi:MAG: AsmA family protein, partial [Acidisphaera sp.]|nr:AsmA family protein [Acidisphaera sp.]